MKIDQSALYALLKNPARNQNVVDHVYTLLDSRKLNDFGLAPSLALATNCRVVFASKLLPAFA